MYRSGKNDRTQVYRKKATIWNICQFKQQLHQMKKKSERKKRSIIMVLLTEIENTFIVCFKLRWAQVIVMEQKRVVHSNVCYTHIYLHSCMHIWNAKLFFSSSSQIHLLIFHFYLEKKKTLNENKFQVALCSPPFGWYVKIHKNEE